MVKLNKRSDGFFETPVGDFAVHPPVNPSGGDKDNLWYEFKLGMFLDVLRLEWPRHMNIITLEGTIAKSMISQGMVRNITDKEMEEYNANLPKEEADLSAVDTEENLENLTMVVAPVVEVKDDAEVEVAEVDLTLSVDDTKVDEQKTLAEKIAAVKSKK